MGSFFIAPTGLMDTARGTGASRASAVLGEGEIVWADMLRDAKRGRLKPVYDARGRLSSSPTNR